MEGSQHHNAVDIIKGFVTKNDGTVFENNNDRGLGGYKFPDMMTAKGIKVWIADIYAEINKRRIIIEIDGDKSGQGHFSPHNKADDDFRDELFLNVYGIPTLRYPTPWIVGEKPVTEAEFLRDVNWKFTGQHPEQI